MKTALLVTAATCFTAGVLSGASVYAVPVIVAVLGFAFIQFLDARDAMRRNSIR